MCIRDRQYTAGKGKEFYNQYFRLVTKWYETVGIGRTGGDIYREVGKLRDHMGIQLNMGHQIHTNEWINSIFFEGSQHPIRSGMAAVSYTHLIRSARAAARTSIKSRQVSSILQKDSMRRCSMR